MAYLENNGARYGIRTRVHSVKGCCPGPLDEPSAFFTKPEFLKSIP